MALGKAMTSARHRILFVDDEPSILAGLKMTFHRDRKRWDMVFANGGDEALAHLNEGAFDVIVSDMRMPKLDGATLLGMVQEQWPGTARMILSGHADREAIIRALPAMHQYLAKPCTPTMLRHAIDRCLSATSVTTDPKLRALIGRLDRLPSPPEMSGAMASFTQNPKSTVRDATSLISRDTAVAAKVLQIANSAAFGEPAPRCSIGEAVQFLGVELLKAIAVTTSLFHTLGDSAIPLDKIQADSVAAAGKAARLADGEHVFVAALLHDVGQIVLAAGLPDEYRAMLAEAHGTGEDICEVERRTFGADHATIGGCLLGMWGLPDPIVDLVTHHHHPRAARSEPKLMAAVHVATTEASRVDVEWLKEVGLETAVEAVAQ